MIMITDIAYHRKAIFKARQSFAKVQRVLWLAFHQRSVEHSRSSTQAKPCKIFYKKQRAKGQKQSFVGPANNITKTWHETHRKKNQPVWTYGCGDTDETVSEGLAEVEIRFLLRE